jgi:hypothetical protein
LQISVVPDAPTAAVWDMRQKAKRWL